MSAWFEIALQTPLNSIFSIHQAVKNLEKHSNNLEIDFNNQASEETLLKFNQSIESIKATISERFPSVNPDDFINFLISSSINSKKLDLNNLIELFKLLDSTGGSTYKVGHSDLTASITVSEPSSTSEKVDKESYFNFFITIVFPILTFLIAQFQVVQTTDQLNRIENQLDQHIEQEKEKENNPYIIEIQNDISPGTRT